MTLDAGMGRSAELRGWGAFAVGIVLALALAACGGGDADPTPTALDPGATPSPIAAWQQEWDTLAAGAKREGRLAMAISSGSLTTYGELFERFEREFDVNVEVAAGRGGDQANRLLAERGAGRYTVDIWASGPGTSIGSIIPTGALSPFAPELFHPEVTDESLWRDGHHWYGDLEQKYVFFYIVRSGFGGLGHNTDLVEKTDIVSLWELFDPKWKGKVLTLDPRDPSFELTGDYADRMLNPDLGEEFMRRFLTEIDVTFVRDTRQLVNSLASGEFALVYPMGPARHEIETASTVGLPVGIMPRPKEEHPSLTGAGSSVISFVERRPHPNAAKLFVNWWLTKETQIAVQDASRFQSMRADIPRDGVREAWAVADDVAVALGELHPQFEEYQAKAQALMDEVFGR